jgi:hypothetical protein
LFDTHHSDGGTGIPEVPAVVGRRCRVVLMPLTSKSMRVLACVAEAQTPPLGTVVGDALLLPPASPTRECMLKLLPDSTSGAPLFGLPQPLPKVPPAAGCQLSSRTPAG